MITPINWRCDTKLQPRIIPAPTMSHQHLPVSTSTAVTAANFQKSPRFHVKTSARELNRNRDGVWTLFGDCGRKSRAIFRNMSIQGQNRAVHCGVSGGGCGGGGGGGDGLFMWGYIIHTFWISGLLALCSSVYQENMLVLHTSVTGH